MNHGRKRIIISPSPVAPQAPTSEMAYAEDPAIGPSPTLHLYALSDGIKHLQVLSS